MRVYVETNFVLECVLGQEQSQSCTAILTLATDGLIELVIPAFSVIEPYQRLTRRKRDRTDLKLRLDRERSEIARVSQYQSRLTELDQLPISSLVRPTARARAWKKCEAPYSGLPAFATCV